MKGFRVALATLACTCGLVWAQDETSPARGFEPATDDQPLKPDAAKTPDQDSRDAVLYSDETESVKPLTRKLMRNILMDQKDIWTSPFHMNRRDAIPWIAFGAATAGLIASDRWTARQLPNTTDQIKVSTRLSNVGAAYTVLPVSFGTYAIGAITHNPKARETGILGGEAALDAMIVVAVLKTATQRPRPLEDNGKGSFFTGGDSFPSGHAAESWALASVFAHEYSKNVVVPITAYGLASLVSFSRLSGRRHFGSDVVAGSAMGWFIGRYVFKTHVDHSIHKRPPSKLARLRPLVIPTFAAETGTRGVALDWELSR